MFNPTIGEVDPSAPPRTSHASRRSSRSSQAADGESLETEVPRAHVKTHLKLQRGGALFYRRKDGLELDELTYDKDPFWSNNEGQGVDENEDEIEARERNGLEPESTGRASSSDDVDADADDSLYPRGWRPKLVVLGSFLSCFTLFGVMNAIGAIEAFIQEHQLATASVSSISWVFSIYMFISLFLGLLVGPLYDTFGATYLLLIGSVMTFVGLFSCGSATTIYQFILSFGLCTGIGTGFLMFPAISVISSWFNRVRRPFYIGVAQTGGSVGGIFFPILLRYLFDKYGFTWAMRIFALFNLGVTLVSVLLTKDRLAALRELTGEPPDERTFWEKLKGSINPSYFRDKKFMMLTSALFMNEFSLLIVLTYLASYAMVYGASASESYMMLTVLNIAGTFGKFIPSYFAQKYGCFNMMILMSVSMTLECFVIWLPFGKYRPALYVFIVLFGFAYAATYSLTGATVGAITTKTKDFGKRYGSAYAIVSVGNLISLPISGAFIVNKTTSDYDNMVAFASASCCVASILFLCSRYTIVGRKLKVAI